MKKYFPMALLLAAAPSSAAMAASNPFADVPAGHWAYDAVRALAENGVRTGEDGTKLRGERLLTRYELAQEVARALAQEEVSAEDRAWLDKLCAEYAEELSAIGVRVSSLEREADHVKWTGEARYRYFSERSGQRFGEKHRQTSQPLQIRLLPTAEVTDHWQVKARLTASVRLDGDTTGQTELTYLYANGKYGSVDIKLGKMPFYSYADKGLIVDGFASGAKLTIGDRCRMVLEAGRLNLAWNGNEFFWHEQQGAYARARAAGAGEDAGMSYQGMDLLYRPQRLFVGLGYRHFACDVFRYLPGAYGGGRGADEANLYSAGLGYRFSADWRFDGAYARNSEVDRHPTSYSLQLGYKGTNKKHAGTWGAYAAYRYISPYVSIMPTYDTFSHITAARGWEIGADGMLLPGVYAAINYFSGKDFAALPGSYAKATKVLFTRVSLFF